MGKLNFYFLRHGQTWFNVFQRLQGWSNSQPTENGIATERQAGIVFANISFDAVYSSDLGRAMITGRIFLQQSEKKVPNVLTHFPAD